MKYLVIYHTSEEEKKSKRSSIIVTEKYRRNPGLKKTHIAMKKLKSTYCECYYDKRNNGEFDMLMWTLNKFGR